MRSIDPLTELPKQPYRIRFLIRAVSYRIAFPVTQMVKYAAAGYCYPQCPRCKRGMDRECTSFCGRCGQKLSWAEIDDAKNLIVPIPKQIRCHLF